MPRLQMRAGAPLSVSLRTPRSGSIRIRSRTGRLLAPAKVASAEVGVPGDQRPRATVGSTSAMTQAMPVTSVRSAAMALRGIMENPVASTAGVPRLRTHITHSSRWGCGNLSCGRRRGTMGRARMAIAATPLQVTTAATDNLLPYPVEFVVLVRLFFQTSSIHQPSLLVKALCYFWANFR